MEIITTGLLFNKIVKGLIIRFYALFALIFLGAIDFRTLPPEDNFSDHTFVAVMYGNDAVGEKLILNQQQLEMLFQARDEANSLRAERPFNNQPISLREVRLAGDIAPGAADVHRFVSEMGIPLRSSPSTDDGVFIRAAVTPRR